MKSIVEHYLDFDEILLPETYITVSIPSWEVVIQPVLQGVLADYQKDHPQQEELTDQVVAALGYPELQTVHDLKTFAMTSFQNREKETKFQQEIFPALLVFFAHTTQTIINEEERDAYRVAMKENYHEEAENLGITYDEFIREAFGISCEDEKELNERIDEYFIYKLIANKRFEGHGLALDRDAYDAYIQEQVIHQMVDEIELRDRLPFAVYQDIFPELLLTSELKTYFFAQIKFEIKG